MRIVGAERIPAARPGAVRGQPLVGAGRAGAVRRAAAPGVVPGQGRDVPRTRRLGADQRRPVRAAPRHPGPGTAAERAGPAARPAGRSASSRRAPAAPAGSRTSSTAPAGWPAGPARRSCRSRCAARTARPAAGRRFRPRVDVLVGEPFTVPPGVRPDGGRGGHRADPRYPEGAGHRVGRFPRAVRQSCCDRTTHSAVLRVRPGRGGPSRPLARTDEGRRMTEDLARPDDAAGRPDLVRRK